MKKKWLGLLLIVLCMLLVIPMIASCSCDGPDEETTTGGGNGENGDNNDNAPSVVLPVVKYLRISEIGKNSVTVKFNALGSNLTYEIKMSDNPITEENFAQAQAVKATVSGDGEVKTFTISDLTVGKTAKKYIAVQASNGAAKSEINTVRAGGIEKIELDPSKPDTIFVGELIRDVSALLDEQEGNDPKNKVYTNPPSNGIGRYFYAKGETPPGSVAARTKTDERYGTDVAPIIDLSYIHYVDSIWIYFDGEPKELDIRSSKKAANFNTPEAWDGTNVTYPASTFTSKGWTEIKIQKEVKYLQVQYLDGDAPTEVMVYGYAIGESETEKIGSTKHKLPTIGELMGQCALLGMGAGECSPEQLECSYVIREYHNVGWSYSISSFPNKSTTLINTVVGNFDAQYKKYSDAGFLVVPCLQWNEASSPARVYNEYDGKLSSTVATWEEKYLPQTYVAYADLIYQYAARYGSSKMGYITENMIAHSDAPSATAQAGLNYIQWIEMGNEPNGEDSAGATPYQLAALTSAAYDGHMRTLLSDIYNPNSLTYFLGGKNADPDIKLAMAGLAGIGDRYIAGMVYWMRANRTDGSIAVDAFNVHTYFGKWFTLNGQKIIVGVSPEEYGLVNELSDLLEYRDKYYPDVEVWITEFGWDTNQSYETMTSAHAYDTPDYDGDGVISDRENIKRAREIQGMWLTRAYLLLSSCGIDKATMYMCEDTAYANELTSIGKYGTCGIWAYRFDDNGNLIYDAKIVEKVGDETKETPAEVVKNSDGKYCYVNETEEIKLPEGQKLNVGQPRPEPKEGYYYMYTLFKTLGNMRFIREIDSGNDDVWIYEYQDEQGNVGYALWCPTSNSTVVEGYKLKIDSDKATLVTAAFGEKLGISSELTAQDGYVTVKVTENPCYVVVNNNAE